MAKIQMTTPLVEMDGDEMTRILWQMIKDELICPSSTSRPSTTTWASQHRNETDDQVTVDSAEATKRLGVAVKCATITPNAPAHGRVRPEADVEEPQRHHPRHAGRHGVPHAHHA